jgi:hypothetical protein
VRDERAAARRNIYRQREAGLPQPAIPPASSLGRSTTHRSSRHRLDMPPDRRSRIYVLRNNVFSSSTSTHDPVDAADRRPPLQAGGKTRPSRMTASWLRATLHAQRLHRHILQHRRGRGLLEAVMENHVVIE